MSKLGYFDEKYSPLNQILKKYMSLFNFLICCCAEAQQACQNPQKGVSFQVR